MNWHGQASGKHGRVQIFLRRTIGKMERYYRRSLVETKMRCVKLFGKRILAHDFDRQVAELQVRATVLNCFTRLGILITVAMPQFRLLKGKIVLSLNCATEPPQFDIITRQRLVETHVVIRSYVLAYLSNQVKPTASRSKSTSHRATYS